MPYSPLLVKPFRDELVVASVKELNTAADVDSFMADKKESPWSYLTQYAAVLPALPAPP